MVVEKNLSEPPYLRAIDLLHLFYNALLFILVLLFRHNQRNWFLYLVVHASLFGGIWLFIKHTRHVKSGFFKLLRDWYTPLMLIFYYEETEPLNHLIIGNYLDPFFVHLEQWVFGFQPSLEFYPAMPWAWFSEIMHTGYFFYYFTIPLLGFVLWLNKSKYKNYHRFVFSYALVMFFCYIYFIVFPSAGPKFYLSEAVSTRFPGYIITPITTLIVENGAVANGAFPSSHVAMSTLILLCVWKFHKRLFLLYLPLVIDLYFSTVYIQAHYAIDVFAGIMVGVTFFLVADKLRHFLECRFLFLLPVEKTPPPAKAGGYHNNQESR